MPKLSIYKYTETETFHFHNANPKSKNAGDCVARAISVALDQSWETTIREMTECGIQIGYVFNEKKTIKRYLESKGWTTYKEPRDHENKKIAFAQFARINKKGTFVAIVGSHHTSLLKDGKIWDTWDCGKKPIHTYWYKK